MVALTYLNNHTGTDSLQQFRKADAIATRNHDLASESRVLSTMLDKLEIMSNRADAEKGLTRPERIQGDLQSDLPSVQYTMQKVLNVTRHDDLGKLAEWYSTFKRKYSTSTIIRQTGRLSESNDGGAFNNPQALHYKAYAVAMIYMVLGNKSRKDKARDEVEAL